ncbi:UDP-N-acetylenolpyruvoylglucosamine reductase [Candidatus Giovannonibacteria bacterium RIFCSPLOWO2_01_FULL_44_40]|uniref:UDP-N-acetylenolpyruvoylglucosamine reductase n=1 Tax=Candidatus Giovannonibacteria bacterium RIFCSPHIGHO2_01_FULL_45_23 TaxID=1798325 RepID=A0A1F5VGD9_9BACT|nr:MAG: UDP-N-acetylenolpyruvoylglucosamine reductase [Candidatus Giovannonibacteria bacterium RIFCSPHIGHO2_01_FULL_45_23]OGF75718.1 MAG: UDP-N-acetylenolpyruvoylglucosamine reductase [Candidatus Giovannonibacteria bacterium RIFCSPHIGHO2_02_FULL_45_13]OGF79955.1 MAG: UDP-N-acetylenolpyruvoylglucosamine reductase [Candidatus Giovannonibacteria bacterium RIFCSPLOWO2_01_FULL_44_40]
MKFLENVSLAPYTSFKIGGPASFFCEVRNKEELKEAIAWAVEKSLPVFVLGGGSNILVSDKGFGGLVIRNSINGIDVSGNFVTVGAGEDWDKFVEFAVSRNLAGIESLSGIPGTAGAAPVQNIGAYGKSVAKLIQSVSAFDVKTGKEINFSNKKCEFGYRTSVFKRNPGRYAITGATFTFVPGGSPKLAYHELKNYFDADASPTLQAVREAILKIRSGKGMVFMGEELHSSVGSFFTNPAISETVLENLKLKVAQCKTTKNCCADPWFWPRSDGGVKISAACLIECAGFEKGMRVGNVGISSLHSLALINYGGASAEEVLALSGDIQNKVKEKFSIELEIEPQLVGF